LSKRTRKGTIKPTTTKVQSDDIVILDLEYSDEQSVYEVKTPVGIPTSQPTKATKKKRTK
jgi:hypothetical protein